MKGKVNEALAHGLPVVSTSIGAQGFNITNGNEMFVADKPEEFADAVLKLLNDPKLQRKMGMAGQQLNENLCSPKVIEKNMDEMFNLCKELQSKQRPRNKTLKIWRVHMYNFLQKYLWKLYN